MCRLIAYAGGPRAIADLVVEPHHSLINQSQAAEESKLSVNGDGFGFAWYGRGPAPGLYRDVLPAWSDENLLSLCQTIETHHFLAHVRASTVGETMRTNCHPFVYGSWCFMHNGILAGFNQIKRGLEQALPDHLYDQRRGTSDSELFFLTLLANGLDEDPHSAVTKSLKIIRDLQAGEKRPNRITAVFSNGKTLYAMRTSSDAKSPSLYYSNTAFSGARVFASEPLDADPTNWTAVAEGSLVCIQVDPSTHETSKQANKFAIPLVA